MTRLGLFLFLVVLVPAGAFWAGNGFPAPAAASRLFLAQARGLAGAGAPAAPTPPEPAPPAPRPAEAEPRPRETPPPPPPADPRAEAEAHFRAGRFEEAAARFAGVDAAREALARLGVALARAFPRDVPDGRYLKLTTLSGNEWEGFARTNGDQIVLVQPGGPQLSLPRSSIRSEVEVPREAALERARKEIAREGASESVTGPRLFVLLQRAFVLGEPATAAELLPRIVRMEAEASEPFFLAAIRRRIPDAAAGEAVFHALAACVVPREPAAEAPSVRAPDRIAEGGGAPAPGKPLVSDPEAQRLMAKARPLRVRAEELYREVALKLIRHQAAAGDRALAEEALRLFGEASRLYQQVLKIEDVRAVAEIDRSVSRHMAKLQFELDHWGEAPAER